MHFSYCKDRYIHTSHYITLHYLTFVALHYITLPCLTLHYLVLPYITYIYICMCVYICTSVCMIFFHPVSPLKYHKLRETPVNNSTCRSPLVASQMSQGTLIQEPPQMALLHCQSARSGSGGHAKAWSSGNLGLETNLYAGEPFCNMDT